MTVVVNLIVAAACIGGFEISSSLSSYNDDNNDGNDNKELVTGGSKVSTREKLHGFSNGK